MILQYLYHKLSLLLCLVALPVVYFLTDLVSVDWSAVYTAVDIDIATEIFTDKFKFVLNQHAPWIVFLQRKNFSPWLTEETKNLMKDRDTW